jgi:hypothetical protein
MTCRIFVTIDLDWASEVVIEETMNWFSQLKIPVTVFATHESRAIVERMNRIEVGLHPYFSSDSSQGSNSEEIIENLSKITTNIPVYRSHRFLDSNQIREHMAKMGMRASSNVCTDLDPVAPFRHRSRMLEVPIAFEDGNFLERKYNLDSCDEIVKLISQSEIFVIAIHPMHFVLNTPHYQWMRDIKDSTTRIRWNNMTSDEVTELRYSGRGIASFVKQLLMTTKEYGHKFEQFSSLIVDV